MVAEAEAGGLGSEQGLLDAVKRLLGQDVDAVDYIIQEALQGRLRCVVSWVASCPSPPRSLYSLHPLSDAGRHNARLEGTQNAQPGAGFLS